MKKKIDRNTSRSRRLLILLAAVPLLATLLQGCGGSNAAPAGDIGVSQKGERTAGGVLNYGFVGTNKPGGVEGWGFHTGIIQEALEPLGITEIKLVPFQTGPDLNESIIGGRVHLGNSGDTPAILARSTGASTKILNFSNTEINTIFIGLKEIQAPEDLAGQKVAVVKGSLMHRFLVGFLNEKGLSDVVEIININSIPDTEAALLRGEIAAYAITSSYYSAYKLRQQGYPLVAEAREYPALYSTSVVYAAEDYLEQYPGFREAWLAARQQAYEDLIAKPDDYYAWLSEQTGTPVEDIKELQPIEALPDEALAAEGIERVEAAKDFLIEEKLARRDFDVDEWILQP
ncbi:ABC transporter substrate-binding protein [Paenibacillus sp. IB182496]|uniref:ABC transporter substrate-binding protein n=1 Tax=Paenibacillus sabuli TaxID=2772509 RepID=A0A927GSX8_9BACL|nr:ABC transporter substrate-binding protein [Paenibacillus sabuli]MBD2846751.1 ABC transporter substrate-binding protein [Paenibacillus sabuli]